MMPFGGSACLAGHSLEKLGCCIAGSAGGMGPGRSRMGLADIGCSFSILKNFTFQIINIETNNV